MIQWLVLDVDGVLTDGTIAYTSSGEEIKYFNAKDGLGLAMARQQGIKLAIITGRQSPMVKRRAQELGFHEIYMGVGKKIDVLHRLCSTHQVPLTDVAYMGDDLNDLSCLLAVGLSMAPSDAASTVRERVQWVSQYTGGHGAVREATEYILQQNGQWERALQSYMDCTHENVQ